MRARAPAAMATVWVGVPSGGRVWPYAAFALSPRIQPSLLCSAAAVELNDTLLEFPVREMSPRPSVPVHFGFGGAAGAAGAPAAAGAGLGAPAMVAAASAAFWAASAAV